VLYSDCRKCPLAQIEIFPLLFTIGAQLAADDGEKWFQVDFLKRTKVTGSKTQGHDDDNFYVKKFSIHYSSDGINFKEHKEYGRTKVGNYRF
jgi:hypothetical protein